MTQVRPSHIFSYGALQNQDVQLALFGRPLHGEPDAMSGYRRELIEITEPDVLATSGQRFHPIIVPSDDPDDTVEGSVFIITEAELAAADRYEVADYRRVSVRLRSGLEAWVYVSI